MFPPLGMVRDGAATALRFARLRWRLLLVGMAIYVLAAVLSPLVLGHVAWLQGAVRSQVGAWVASLPLLVLLAPIWTALYRFVILKEAHRGYAVADIRFWRVLLTGFVLSLIGFFGGMALVVGTVLMTGMGARRLVIFAIMVGSALLRVAAWWFSLRLAIAPPLGAAGARPRPLDTAFSYTQGAVWRILVTKMLIYLPLFLAASAMFLAAHLAPRLQSGTVVQYAESVAVSLITACTDLLDGATMAMLAMHLVRARRSATLAEAAEAAS